MNININIILDTVYPIENKKNVSGVMAFDDLAFLSL